MKVLVTGGTGFLGSHTVAALVRRGHAVRILARSPGRVAPALAPHGSPAVEVERGDVLDRPSVEAALEGCDAVIHAANVFSTDPRRGDEMLSLNVKSTELVLGAAAARGLDPIVHVSSVVALIRGRGGEDDETLPGEPRTPYPRSKAAADRVARAFQERGAPVVTTYPGGLYGPHDPGAGEQTQTLRGFLLNRYPLFMPGAFLPIADVRWVAEAHAALVEPGRGPRRVNLGGSRLAWDSTFRLLREITGRRLPQLLPTPRWAVEASARAADAAQRWIPVRMPFSSTSIEMCFAIPAVDDRTARSLVGEPPPVERTLADGILWNVRAGHLPPSAAGRLLERAEAPAG